MKVTSTSNNNFQSRVLVLELVEHLHLGLMFISSVYTPETYRTAISKESRAAFALVLSCALFNENIALGKILSDVLAD
jgi:hypothetical protein